ncbi:MAG TPA: tetratricopeptide repeat protein [Terriglobales bacterium]|nr:tetratricopeptide repeat protein [Terriglobales bacterium]
MRVAHTNRTLLFCLLLAVGTVVVYSRVAHYPFLKYDDDHYVTENSHVRAGISWNTVVWAFTSFDEANWHPLTWLSHALDVQLFGLNSGHHHATSLLIHTANVVLLFLLLQVLTGFTWRSFAVAALFAVHPINIESVAWIAERKTVLCMFFFLLTLIAYIYYSRRPTPARYCGVLVLFALALMAKPMAVTLPFVLLLLDYWPLGRLPFSSDSNRDSGVEIKPVTWLTLEKLPFFCLSAASSALTLKAQRAAGAVTVQHAFATRLENTAVSYVLYLEKAIWPAKLPLFYPYPRGGWPLWVAVSSFFLLLVITAFVLRFRQRRYLAWGWFWFLGTMVPMIGLVQVGTQAMADRYAYLPFVGLFVMAVWGFSELAAYFRVSVRYAAAAGVIAVIALAASTYQQLAYWRDDYSLWSHTLAITRNNFVAEDNVGEALVRQGKYYDGIAHFRAAAAIEPADPVSQVNLGIYALQQHDLQQAAARLQNALQLSAESHLRATAYANLGSVYFSLHDYDRARQNLESALQWKANFPFVFLDLGLIAQKANDWNTATRYYAMYAGVEPTDVAYFLLGQSLEHGGDQERAKLAYDQAQRISQDINKTREEVRNLLTQ